MGTTTVPFIAAGTCYVVRYRPARGSPALACIDAETPSLRSRSFNAREGRNASVGPGEIGETVALRVGPEQPRAAPLQSGDDCGRYGTPVKALGEQDWR
jgi:hypothetical protein